MYTAQTSPSQKENQKNASGFATLSLGSQGSDVSTLQTLLNRNGASLQVDGVFDEKTQSALKTYQSRTGLEEDGVAGENTWAALTAPVSSATAASPYTGLSGVSENTAQHLQSLEEGFTPSDAAQSLRQEIEQLLSNTPADFASPYQSQLDELTQALAQRESFSYHPESDPLFSYYRDLAQTGGRLSMMDAMGQAAALTGGYASSYAQTLGQQAYDQSLSRLYERLPDFYSMALSAYQTEGDRLSSLYNNLHSLYEDDYSRYQDDYSRYLSLLTQKQNLYESQLDADFAAYSSMLSYWQDMADLQMEDYWKRADQNPVKTVSTVRSTSSSSSDLFLPVLEELFEPAASSSSSSSSSSSKKKTQKNGGKSSGEETYFFSGTASSKSQKSSGKNKQNQDEVYYF